MRDAALAARGQAPRGARGSAPQAPQAPPFTLLFFHLEKCGGTSVASWLGSLKRQRYDAGYALNDAVFLPAAPKDLGAIHSALQTLLGFDMELKVVAVE